MMILIPIRISISFLLWIKWGDIVRKKYKYRFNYLGFDIDKLKLIGQGQEGKVYLLPNDKVLKVFHNTDSCMRQIEILIKARDSRFFPTVFDFDNYSIIMSFVYGSTLSYYLKQNKINKNLSLELVKLIDEFKKLHFTRLDMRLGHIFLQPDETIKVIDPRASYERIQPYPKSMLKGLQKCNVLNDFFKNIKHDYPDYYKYWKKMTS
jgi:RIO-like serine/threonine protein kinase